VPDLIIRNAPDATVKALEAIAERRCTTVSEVALEYLPKNAPLSPDEAIAMMRRLRERSIAKSNPDSTALIRGDRDGVSENELAPEEAIELARSLRNSAPREIYPDSTPGIRADRDER
jgi:hypothetical protein